MIFITMGHLKENNLSWFQHFKGSWIYIWKLLKIIFKLFVHSFFPNIFRETGVKNVIKSQQKKVVLSYSNRNSN